MIPTPDAPTPRDSTVHDEARQLRATNQRRRRARRWIIVGSLPLVLAAVLFSAKLTSMYAFAYQSISAFVAADYAGTIRGAQGQNVANWFEKHKAPFNEGVGLAASGELAEAQEKFEQALGWAEGMQQCDIRVNLALVLEWQGDAAESDNNPEDALAFYAEALKVNAEAPEECNSDEADEESSDSSRDMSESLDEQQKRLQEKHDQQDHNQQQKPDDSTPDGEQQQSPTPDDSALDELQRKLAEGERERQQREQENQGDYGGYGTDKPW